MIRQNSCCGAIETAKQTMPSKYIEWHTEHYIEWKIIAENAMKRKAKIEFYGQTTINEHRTATASVVDANAVSDAQSI